MTKEIKKEEHIKFDAEVGKILQLMIHSLYANKDIFLRELISNSSDACDKLRYLSITSPGLIKDDTEFKIKISSDGEKRILTISDNGIGMNREDLIENIGTIARSGTQNFLSNLTGNKNQDMQLIGQFGVGFYSGFMVANEMEVITKKAGENEVWQWKSKGDGEYTLKQLDEKDLTSRGTQITLHLKDGQDEFLDKFRLRHIVKTYSDHISFPIEFTSSESETEIFNNSSAIWMRPKSEITEEQHKEFYKQVAHLPDNPWHIIHNKNEGMVEYTNLLYIPSSKPFDLFSPDRKSKVKLYVKKVYIGDEGLNLVPSYMRFLHGVIDSADLPLNISRETLQHNSSLEKIRKSVIKKVISELKTKLLNDRDSYTEFWNNFGAVIKEGLCESMPSEEKEKLLEICLFKSALTDKYISLSEYIENMKEGQNTIFYLSGDNIEKAKNSPQLEGFLKHNIDVILFTDTVDDFWVNVMHTYKDKEMKSATRSDIEFNKILNPKAEGEEEVKEEIKLSEHEQTLVDFFKNTLGETIKDAKISSKLVGSPVCLSVAAGAMDIRMERYLKDQKQIGSSFAKNIEININHPIIEKISQSIEKNNELAKELTLALFDQACIIEGEPLSNPAEFSKRMNSLLEKI
jgi:molecular chaperone HtpG